MDIAFIKKILSKNLEHIIPIIEKKFSVDINTYEVASIENENFSKFISSSKNTRKQAAIVVCFFSIKFNYNKRLDLSFILDRFKSEEREYKTLHIREFVQKEFGGGNFEILDLDNYVIIYYLIDKETRIL